MPDDLQSQASWNEQRVSEKKAQPHIKAKLVPEDLEYPSRAISRQGRLMPLQAQANDTQAAAPQAAERERVAVPLPAHSQQSSAYSGTVMSEALQRKQDTTQKKQLQSASAGLHSAAAGLKAAHTTRPAVGLTQQRQSFSNTQPVMSGQDTTSAAKAYTPKASPVAHPQGASVTPVQKPQEAGTKLSGKERIQNIFNYDDGDEPQYRSKLGVSGGQKKSSYAASARSRDMQWYPYFVAGSNTSLLLSVIACLFLGFVLVATPLGQPFGLYARKLLLSPNAFPSTAAESGRPLEARLTPNGEHVILGEPTISPQDIDYVLKQYSSPAAGQGKAFYELGRKYNIDPAYALAFFIHESSAGTNAAWAGLKPDGSSTHNVGNIICAGYKTCYNRFRDYSSWEEGIEDWYRLLSDEYINGRGASTVEQIIPIYAPSFENNVPAYIDTVTSMVNEWRVRGVH